MCRHDGPGSLRRTRTLVAAVAVALAPSCGPSRAKIGEAVKFGDVSVEVASIRHLWPCLAEPGRTSIDQRPTLAIELIVRNTGDTEVRYEPRHGRARGVEPNDVALVAGGEVVPSIAYDPGVLVDGQLTEPTTLASGDELRDVYLFEPPRDEPREWLLTLPGVLWGRDGALEIRLAHELPALERSPERRPGEAAVLEPARVTVLDARVVLPVFRSTAGAWDADEAPALAVRYSIRGVDRVVYDAEHGSSASWGPIVRTGSGTVVPAIRYDAAPELRDQLRGRIEIPAGETRLDYALFNLPPPGTDALQVEFPGSVVGGKCAALWRLKWSAHAAPTKEEALRATP